MSEEEVDRPWTEEQWEKFMKEGDLRAARFGELLETLIDHPDCDEQVAREMGWDDLADAVAEKRSRADEEVDRFDDDLPAFEAGEDEDDEDPVESIRAYVMAIQVGEKVSAALKPWTDHEPVEDDEAGERLGEAFIGIHIAAAKLAGGHGMGYEDDSLCGNIVCCKRALEGALKSERTLAEMKEKGDIPSEIVDRLLPDVRAVRVAIEERIAELRLKVWW